MQQVNYLVNPTKNEIQAFIKTSETGWLRGIVSLNSIVYIWDARLYDHNYVIKSLNLSEKARFMVDKKGISTHTQEDYNIVVKEPLSKTFTVRVL